MKHTGLETGLEKFSKTLIQFYNLVSCKKIYFRKKSKFNLPISVVRSLVAIFVVRTGVGRVPIGGATYVIQHPTLVEVGSRTRGVPVISPASCFPIIAQMSSSNRRSFSREIIVTSTNGTLSM